MNLLPTSEQEEFVSSSAAFLASMLPSPRELAASPEGVDAAVWRASAELGWLGLALGEELGGAGAGLADEALLFRELGRALAPGPYLATVLGARVAAFGGESALAEEIVAGRRRVGLALAADELVLEPGKVDGALLLVDAAGASHVLAVTPELAVLVACDALERVVDTECIDEATRLARAHANRVGVVASVGVGDDPVWARGLVCSAAMLTGIAEASRDLATEYAKTRVQFDRPIGVHQAVKHPCADMAVRAEAAWAQTVVAARALDERHESAEMEAMSARVVAQDAAERSSTAALQVLGGIGFTDEHEIHRYVKRTHVLAHCVAERSALLDRLVGR